MKMISYWKQPQAIYQDGDFVLIVGGYNHKNKQAEADKCLGVHWGTYPQSRGILSPCVIPKSTADAILAGLLHQAIMVGATDKVDSLTYAIKFLNDPN